MQNSQLTGAFVSLLIFGTLACGSAGSQPEAKAAAAAAAAPSAPNAPYTPGTLAIVVNGIDREPLDTIVEWLRTTDKRDVRIVGLTDRLSYSTCGDNACKAKLGASIGASRIVSLSATKSGLEIRWNAEVFDVQSAETHERMNGTSRPGGPLNLAICKQLVSSARISAALLEGEPNAAVTTFNCDEILKTK